MRCKACDCILSENEIIFRKDINKFEDLCKTCRQSIQNYDIEELDPKTMYHQSRNLSHYEDELIEYDTYFESE